MSRNADYRAGYFSEVASKVAQALRRDDARKQRIFTRSPGVFNGIDAAEFAGMSSRELAERELKELGIDPGEHDPEALLDAHHAGRKWARDRTPGSGGAIIGGKPRDIFNPTASDSAEPTFLDRYLEDR